MKPIALLFQSLRLKQPPTVIQYKQYKSILHMHMHMYMYIVSSLTETQNIPEYNFCGFVEIHVYEFFFKR